jgi:hypothetical protein
MLGLNRWWRGLNRWWLRLLGKRRRRGERSGNDCGCHA